MLQVKAIRLGYYNHLRRKVGEVFHVPEKLFSENWMVKVDGEKVKASKEEPKAKAVKRDEPVI